MVIDTDGSAFITKAEFDSLKNNFQAQIDNYNSSIDSKIDGAIASYLAGIKLSSQIELTNIYNQLNSIRTMRWYGSDIVLHSDTLTWYEYTYHGVGAWGNGRYANHEITGYHPNTPYTATTWYLKYGENDFIEDWGTFYPRLFVMSTDVNTRTDITAMGGIWQAISTGNKMLESGSFCYATLDDSANMNYFTGIEIERSSFTPSTYVPLVPNKTSVDYCGLIGGSYSMRYSGTKQYHVQSDTGVTFTNISGGSTHVKSGGMIIYFKYPDELYNKGYNVKDRIFKPFYDICDKVGPMSSGIPVASCEQNGRASLEFKLSIPGSFIIYVNSTPDASRIGKHQYTGSTTSNNQIVSVNDILCEKDDTIYILYLPNSTSTYGTITFNKATLTVDN